ncbi:MULTISPECIES: hypothetical protein [Sphingomonadales]|uniref:Uncharacterized protein n=1 Tax=Tsuneonella aeria TaxID=1837929 RepID=A0A6I4TEG0_9SPHN|nr:hypothetical protein [Tsuneonella aeria]MXO75969.1 hypothetical protein [Tsuneonella aeria]
MSSEHQQAGASYAGPSHRSGAPGDRQPDFAVAAGDGAAMMFALNGFACLHRAGSEKIVK